MQISQETPEVIIEQCINQDGGQDEAERLQSSKVALENCSNNEDSDGQEVADTSDVLMHVGTKKRRVNFATPKVRKRRSDLASKRKDGASQGRHAQEQWMTMKISLRVPGPITN
jgi:hypothetical protein